MARILVVDDDPLVADTLRAMLGRAGHTVTVACDGRIGLDMVQAGAFDLLLVDLVMPVVNGIEVINKLRDTGDEVPIVAMSGGTSVNETLTLENAAEAGANQILRKPFKVASLIAAIDACLN